MKPERRIVKFLRRIDVKPDAERKRLRLEELLEARDKTQEPKSAETQPTIRRIIMNRHIWKVAASLVVAAIAIGIIGTLQNGNQAAHAFEQTVAAMQGGYSYHIQTYYGSPTQRHDEFWAEFNEQGKLIRLRQKDQWQREKWPVEILWENHVEQKYHPGVKGPDVTRSGILVIRKTSHHVDENVLEEFDPEIMIEEVYRNVENGEATIKFLDSPTKNGNLVFEATGNHPYRYVISVDPQTSLVVRMDQYNLDDEGNEKFNRGIEVLAYNQPFDQKLFKPDFPSDTIIIDQISGPVGMDEGELRLKDVAYEVARQALEAWSADDYETAGPLFGGAPKEFFDQLVSLKPVSDITVTEINPYEWYGPTFKVTCRYLTEQEGEQITIKITLWIKTNEGQPGRWYIDPTFVDWEKE